MKDILAEFDKLLRSSGDDGMTSSEIAAAKGCTTRTIVRIIKQQIAAGHFEYAGKKMVPNITGVMCPTPAYRLTSKKSPKKKARS